jgi:SET family sugar efflux transporter-like MFS transporter
MGVPLRPRRHDRHVPVRLATSAVAPQIGIFLVTDLGASLPTAGLFYLTSLAAPVAGYLVGARSDRSGNRFGL